MPARHVEVALHSGPNRAPHNATTPVTDRRPQSLPARGAARGRAGAPDRSVRRAVAGVGRIPKVRPSAAAGTVRDGAVYARSVGTRGFLFTDIEGSTNLWSDYPALMPAVLASHDNLITEAVVAAGGEVFKHTGDGVCAVFTSDGEQAKVVVWAHNSHLGDARATVAADGPLNVGQLVRERLPGDNRPIGFTTFTGTVTAADDRGPRRAQAGAAGVARQLRAALPRHGRNGVLDRPRRRAIERSRAVADPTPRVGDRRHLPAFAALLGARLLANRPIVDTRAGRGRDCRVARAHRASTPAKSDAACSRVRGWLPVTVSTSWVTTSS
jgi:Erythromycin esterase